MIEPLLSAIKTTFGLKGNIRLQYMEKDFGNNYFNLNSTTELKDLGTIKVINQQTNPPLISDIRYTSLLSLSFESEDGASLASDAELSSHPLSLCHLEHNSGQRTLQFPNFHMTRSYS